MTSTEILATVPRFATTGKITVTGQLPDMNSPSVFAVDSYRNTAGFSFHNYTPHITFDQLTMAFGASQTYDEIDFCWPFGCTISVRDPVAMILNGIANAAFSGANGGACFGFALASPSYS
jgi:hypothetical protein